MLADRYPSNIGPLYNNEYEAVLLKDVDAATLVSKKLCDPYVMGYVPTEKYPGNFYFNLTKLSDSLRQITFDNILAQKNIGWGFAIVGNYSSGVPNMLAITNSNALYNTSSLPNNDCIVVINKVQMAKMCTRATLINCMLSGLIMPIDDEPSDDAVFFSNTYSRWKTSTLQIGISDYKAMMDSAGSDNPSRFRFSINFDGANRYFNICDDDFNDFNIAKLHDENNEYTLYCTITNFTVNENRSYYGYSGISTEVRCTPFYRIPLTEDNTQNLNTDICACFMPFYGYGSHDWRFDYNTGTDTLSIGGRAGAWNFAGYDIGNFPYTIDLDELQSISSFNYNHDGIVYGKYLINQKGYGSGYWSFSIIRQNRFSDGWKQYALYHKSFVNGETYSASDYPKYNGRFEVSIFDDNDTPTLTREPTLSSYPVMYDKLRPWQKLGADITEDDFDPADIPEWVPPGPEPTEWGDDRFGSVPGLWLGSDGITANFITPWVLRGSQVTNFGQFLWENLFLPDPDDPSIINGLWHNFLDALGTYWQTGSFDPASTLDFVISLMFFPFKLDTLSSDSGGKKLYFGTGALGLTVSSSYNTRRLTAYHGYLNAGSLDLTDNTVKSSLGVPDDFRGLANTSACIYLPFCGTYQVNWADVRDSLLSITYAIDFTTGACTAYVLSTKDGKSTYILTATGMLGFSVPLTATNANRLVSSILGDVAQSGAKYMDIGTDIGTKIISGGQADKPSQVSGGASDDDLGNALTLTAAGGPVGSVVGGFTMAGKTAKELFSKPSIGIPMMAGGSGWDALHCPRTPYLQVRTPQYVPDAGHGHALGWPAEKQATTISSLPRPAARNYYECVNVDTSTLSCTHEERQIIKQQLETGFYIKAE